MMTMKEEAINNSGSNALGARFWEDPIRHIFMELLEQDQDYEKDYLDGDWFYDREELMWKRLSPPSSLNRQFSIMTPPAICTSRSSAML